MEDFQDEYEASSQQSKCWKLSGTTKMRMVFGTALGSGDRGVLTDHKPITGLISRRIDLQGQRGVSLQTPAGWRRVGSEPAAHATWLRRHGNRG